MGFRVDCVRFGSWLNPRPTSIESGWQKRGCYAHTVERLLLFLPAPRSRQAALQQRPEPYREGPFCTGVATPQSSDL